MSDDRKRFGDWKRVDKPGWWTEDDGEWLGGIYWQGDEVYLSRVDGEPYLVTASGGDAGSRVEVPLRLPVEMLFDAARGGQ